MMYDEAAKKEISTEEIDLPKSKFCVKYSFIAFALYLLQYLHSPKF